MWSTPPPYVDKSWLEMDIDALLTARLGRPVEVINDADAAGLAEARFGAGEFVKGTVLVITLGTGIGLRLHLRRQACPQRRARPPGNRRVRRREQASAVARERDGLSWEEYSVLLQRYLSHVEFLFSPNCSLSAAASRSGPTSTCRGCSCARRSSPPS